VKPADSVSTLKNVGAERSKLLNSLGIHTLADLAFYFPRDYEDRSRVSEIADVRVDMTNTIKGFVTETPRLTRAKGFDIIKCRISDNSGVIEAVWFNQPYLKSVFKREIEYSFTGKVTEKRGVLQIESPEYEKAGEASANYGRIIPVYPLIKGLTQKLLRGLIEEILPMACARATEFLPPEIIKRQGLLSADQAIKNIHFPETNELFYAARKRLVFDELFITQLSLRRLKSLIKSESLIVTEDLSYGDILARLPFSPTNAQIVVINDIIADFKSGLCMARLLQGDVGSGKTLVAAIAARIIINNGYQAVLMAPTEVLAEQHFEFFSELFCGDATLLTGAIKGQKRAEVYESVKNGNARMIIGTHALLTEGLEFFRPGLVITDEQHRFGVAQRIRLADKGHSPHTLVMTATPIPRTLALILYGDLDISVIDELPAGRRPVETYAVDSSVRPRIFGLIKRQVKLGRQAYIICPAIENSDEIEMESVLNYTEKLRLSFPELRVEFLHGGMKNAEKDEIMRLFARGGTDVLVSTTVVEVGINVPNATVMLIENAERFGLAQLHQLRGRVGRGTEKSYCILLSDSKSPKSRERLNILAETNDGFAISELDLKQRGQGDFFGTRQSGAFVFRLANICEDMTLLLEAQKEAENYMNQTAVSDKIDAQIAKFLENYSKASI